MPCLRRLVASMLLASMSAAAAAPLVPPSDLPGRERYRFTPTPLDRFMQPIPREKPLLRWDCRQPRAWHSKQRFRRGRDC
jgi:hypothetical protein